MASLIVATGGSGYVSGVAPAAKILPIAIPLAETRHKSPPAHYVARAIRYAADAGAQVISMSFGGDRSAKQNSLACPASTQDAILYALAKGAVVVAASGNSGQRSSPVEEPSVCLGVVSVGAVDGQNRRAAFSSRHRYLTVAAPGVNVTTVSASGQVYIGAGTSHATALTAGALALIWSAHPRESNRQIVTRLLAGLEDAGSPGRDSSYGYGIVNAGASARTRLAPSAGNPVFAAVAPFLARLHPARQPLPPPARAVVRPPGAAEQVAAPSAPFPAATILGLATTGLGIVLLSGWLVFALHRMAGRWSTGRQVPAAAE
jgi:subtilisin family serine protease